MRRPLAPFTFSGSTQGVSRDEVRSAYLELHLACREAHRRGLDPRARPIALPRFRQIGVGNGILLWMLYQGHVEHLRTVPALHKDQRTWYQLPSLRLLESSWFALTEEGSTFADRLLADIQMSQEGHFHAMWELLQRGRLVPHYDRVNRVFAWGQHMLKCFRQPSYNQEIILSAAEELKWSTWFDDPLPRSPGMNPKVRLHDTIKDLNRRQTPSLIHFIGDGTGTRIGWEYR